MGEIAGSAGRTMVGAIRKYAILELDSAGIIRSWNAGACRILGYEADEAIGRHFASLYAAADTDAGAAQQHLKAAAADGEANVRQHLMTKRSASVFAEISITAIFDERRTLKGFAVVVEETTDHEKPDGTTRLMVDLALNAMILVNRHGEIVRVNPQTEKLFGYSGEELIGQQVEMLMPEGLRARHPGYRDAFFANPAIHEMGAGRDLRGRRKNGTEFPVEIALNPVQVNGESLVLGSIVDITERKRAVEMFRIAMESAPSAMVMVNDRGEIVLVNQQTERVFGYSRDELLGQSVELLVPDRFRGQHPAQVRSFFAAPVARPIGAGRDLTARRRDGTEFPAEIALTPIETADGLFVLSAVVDITERKEAEERSRLHLAEMAHALRLSTVGEMFSGLAHEINQPLAAAANYARTCLRYSKSDQGVSKKQMIEWIEKTHAQAARAIDIVKRVGAFVRRDHSQHIKLNLNGLIQEVLKLPGVATGVVEGATPIVPQLDLEEPLPLVSADRVQIEQVFVNLFRNAVESMAGVPASRRRLVVRTSRDDRYVTVSISDNGHGISPENLAKLFQPFFTTKQDGMGLGLPISRSIIEAHLGQLTAESEVGVGTAFRFTLPYVREEGSA